MSRLRNPWIAFIGGLGVALLIPLSNSAAPTNGDAPDAPPARLSGQVQLPDGAPAVDAPVVVFWRKLYAQTHTNAEGRFELKLDPQQMVTDSGAIDWKRGSVAAGKAGLGPAWMLLRNVRENEPLTLKLVEDLPVRGRILDQQGQPVPGAEVSLVNIHGGEGKLDDFLRTNRDNPTDLWVFERDQMQYLPDAVFPILTQKGELGKTVLRTNQEGAFELTGIGRERSVLLRVSAPNIVSENVYVVTRPEIDARWNRGPLNRNTRFRLDIGDHMPVVYPATFRHLGEPGLVVAGVVRDAATNEPVEGMNVLAGVRGASSGNSTKTDARGRYRLGGLKAEGKLTVNVLNPGDKPWLDATRVLDVRADQRPGDIDFRLSRGIIVDGRVTHLETGEAVRGWVGYLGWGDNPELAKLAQPYDSNNRMMTNEQGEYQIVAPAGPGVLTFVARDRRFALARSEDFGFPLYEGGQNPMFDSANMGLVMASQYHALRRIEPSASVTRLKIDLVISSGKPIPGRVVGADGNPVKERIIARGLTAPTGLTRLDQPKFDVRELKPGEQRTVFFRDEEKRSAAIHRFTMPAEGLIEEVVVRLQPCGTVSGRIIGPNGRPLSRWRISVMSSGGFEWLKAGRRGTPPAVLIEFAYDVETDADGYFRVAGIPAGHMFEVVAANSQQPDSAKTAALVFSGIARPGQQLDLGALSVTRAE